MVALVIAVTYAGTIGGLCVLLLLNEKLEERRWRSRK